VTRVHELAVAAWKRIDQLGGDPVTEIQRALVTLESERTAGLSGLDRLSPGDREVALALWGSKEASRAAIAKAIGIRPRTCMHRLLRLERLRVVQRTRFGHWRLVVGQYPLCRARRMALEPREGVLRLARKHGTISATIVATEQGVPLSTAYTRLYYLCRDGHLVRTRRGEYRLPERRSA
jgi:hypothetical protein